VKQGEEPGKTRLSVVSEWKYKSPDLKTFPNQLWKEEKELCGDNVELREDRNSDDC
jgi:hypothetical protein